MCSSTPSKLITDYFTKSPPRNEENQNDTNVSKLIENKVSTVLPPTPENSPSKDLLKNEDAVQNTLSEKTKQKSPFKDNSDNSEIQTKRAIVSEKLLSRDKNCNKSESKTKDDNVESSISIAKNTQTEILVGTKKTRRRRGRRRKEQSAANQSTDDIITSKSSSAAPKKPPTSQNKLVTDYFPVRRSGRQCESKIKEDKEKTLRDLITSNCEDGLEVIEIEGKGRGVVATKTFNVGDFIVEYAGELVLLSTAIQREDYYSKDEDIGCYMYYFMHKSQRYCIDATKETGRLGRLLNHSKLKGNCHTKVVEVNDTPRLILVAMKKININTELLYDYGDRSPSSLLVHPWLKE